MSERAENIAENIDRFEKLMGEINRPGIENLMNYIRESDFYVAPASAKYHCAYEGGLLEHSLNVFDCLVKKMDSEIWGQTLTDLGRESIILTSLMHDICKTNYYCIEMKNKKVYSDEGKRVDSNGRYDWQSVPGYSIEDKIPYGHGEKSVMMVEQFLKLKPVERYMIRWHMLFTEPKELWGTIGLAIQKFPSVLAISEADLESTYLLEPREE